MGDIKQENFMKFVFASDSFKGSISSCRAAMLLHEAANEIFPNTDIISIAVADGGEGTVDAIMDAVSGEYIAVQVMNPVLQPVTAYYGRLDDKRAVAEMASASGLTLIDDSLRNPMNTTSQGTGELIKAMLDEGYSQISIAIGGSATNDGGMGCMKALGVRFLDENENELIGCGRDLIKVRKIDISNIHPRVRDVKFTVMCDVKNPLCGKDGATMTFGKQKGGTPQMLEELEEGMKNYRDVIKRTFDTDPDQIPGSGAAGGLGAALSVFLSAEYKSGVEAVLEMIGFDDIVKDADLVVTGEGRTDWQSCFGKVLQGIGNHCRALGIPAISLSGSLGDGAEKIFDEGIESVMTTVNSPITLEEAMSNAEEFYKDAAIRMFRIIRVGMMLKNEK